jgi:hypothetical protein
MSWRERFREDNELLFAIFGPMQRKIYGFAGLLTFFYQARPRWELCEGVAACGLSYGKGVVWSILWPIYWINHVSGDPISLVLRSM